MCSRFCPCQKVRAAEGHSLQEEALILDHHADLQEGYAQQLSISAGQVLVTELQLCQMQVCLSCIVTPVVVHVLH